MESTLLESGEMEKTTKYHLNVHLNNVGDLYDMECDDIASQTVHSIGDFRRVFVR